jgi:hypothetical protein
MGAVSAVAVTGAAGLSSAAARPMTSPGGNRGRLVSVTALRTLPDSAAPIRLYLATNDEQAVNANTRHCQADFTARHRQVPVIDLGTPSYQGSRHLGSNVAGTARIVRWFVQLTH